MKFLFIVMFLTGCATTGGGLGYQVGQDIGAGIAGLGAGSGRNPSSRVRVCHIDEYFNKNCNLSSIQDCHSLVMAVGGACVFEN